VSNDSEYVGFGRANTAASEFNSLQFSIDQAIQRLATSMPVKVVAVRGGGVAPVGFVDVVPMVQQVSGDGTLVDHGIIPNVPYVRLQGGSHAVIIDPTVGDIGVACFSSRDITAVKNARDVAPPGSGRLCDFSDGMYIGGMLNATPDTYIHFDGSSVVIRAATVRVEGNLHVTGTTTTSDSIVLDTHKHTGVQPGSGNSGGPINA
jgi:hypothetical protein